MVLSSDRKKHTGGNSETSMMTNHLLMIFIVFLPEAILLTGISIGWYTRYSHYELPSLLALGICGLFVITGNLALHYYFRLSFLNALAYLWIGCLLGIISFMDFTDLPHRNLENIMNLLLMSSAICQAIVEVVVRCCKSNACRGPVFFEGACGTGLLCFASHELFQLLGIAVSCVVLGDRAPTMLALMAAFCATLVAIRMKSYLGLVNLAFVVCSSELYLFPDINLSVNPYALLTTAARFAIPAVFDLFLWSGRGSSRLERWQPFILAGKFKKRLVLVFVLIAESIFFAVMAASIGGHKEWYIVVPFFALVSLAWILLHLIFLVILGTLINKFHQVRELVTEMTSLLNMKQILAARGVRYFSLIAQRLAFFCIISTVLIATLCWTTRTPYSHSLLSLCVAVELLFCDLLNEFSTVLGGTCVGYAVVAPVASLRSDGGVTILPPNFIQEAGSRSTQTMNAIIHFLSSHMITNAGCDWSMAGIDSGDLEKKLRDFFSKATPEGPRYDTYLLYYCGPVTAQGDWALTNNGTLPLDQLLEIWHDSPTSKSSRLLLVIDAEKSDQWLQSVRRNWSDFVALQTVTYRLGASKSPKESSSVINISDGRLSASNSSANFASGGPNVGDFTRVWVDFNVNNRSYRDLLSEGVYGINPNYSVSRRWTDFSFHWPNSEEIRSYWLSYLPKVTWRLLSPVIGLMSAKLPFTCCECFTRCFKRLRQRFWPPYELDTGHGFRLLKA